MVRFRVLGPVTAEVDDRPLDIGGLRQRRLLAGLLVHANRVAPADVLIEIVFDGAPSPRARTTLRSYIARLRRALAAGGGDRPVITTTPPGYALVVDQGVVDATTFEDLARRGMRDIDGGAPDAAVRSLEDALQLWRGRAFGEFADEAWVRAEAARLDELRVVAEESLIDARLALGLAAETVPDLRRLVEQHPLRDRLREQLMLALHRSGRRAEALATYRSYRRELVDVGLEPGADLTDLSARLAVDDPELMLQLSHEHRVRGYALGEIIGRGAHGVVHRAVQPGVGREVAVKIIRPDLADDPTFVHRFEAEAQVVAHLEHPAVVPLYDYWREPGGAYMVMRLLSGGSLADRLADAPLTVRHVVRVAAQLGGALATAHRTGITHRDVKPSNVLLDDDGNAYLSDFGIAGTGRVTSPGVPTAHSSPYASPERVQGRPVGPAGDQYSLAVLVIEALTGRRPPPAANGASDPAVGVHDPVHSDDADRVLRRAVAADPADRYPNVTAFTEALLHALGERARPGREMLTPPVANPYKGLRSFRAVDADHFFGRDASVDELLERMDGVSTHVRFTAVVGASGSGKSSLVHAGLIPRLRNASTSWFVATMTPGELPLTALDEALRSVTVGPPSGPLEPDPAAVARRLRATAPADGHLVLVIDQLEELFTLVDDDAERDAIIDGLTDAVDDPTGRVHVVVTLRADLYDRPLRYHRFGRLLRAGTVTVVGMDADELGRAVVGPAAAVGVDVEAALARTLVADVLDQPAALPLLQFTLTELFERRTAGRLTSDAYLELGGVAGAISRRADHLCADLPAQDLRLARRMFLRLVTVGGTGTGLRSAPRSELTSIADDTRAAQRLIDRFVAARLMTLDRDPSTRAPTVAIAHEALVRHWPRLRDWVTEEGEGLRIRAHLTDAATAWERLGRDPGDLYRGARLADALTWADDQPGALPGPEREFLDRSRAQHEAEQRARREQLEHQTRANRRLRGVLAIAGIALIAAVIAGAVAWQQRSDARREARRADARASAATLGMVAAVDSAIARDRDLALLLAMEARRIDDSPTTRRALFGALTSDTPIAAPVDTPADSYRAVRVSADGAVAVARRDDGLVDIVDLSNRRVTGRPWRAPRLPAGGLDIRPDGRIVAAAGFAEVDGTAVVFHDLQTGQRVGTIDGPPGEPHEVRFSPDGRFVAVADGRGRVSVLRAGDLSPVVTLRGAGSPVTALAFDDDGSALTAGTMEGRLLRWDVASGEMALGPRDAHADIIVHVAIDPTTARTFTASVDGTVRGWTTDGLEADGPPLRHGDAVTGLAISPDGAMLAASSHLGLRLVDAATDDDITPPLGSGTAAAGVAFTPDGSSLVAAEPDGRVVVWSLGGTDVLGRALEPAGPGFPTFSPDGSLLAVWARGRGVQLFDGATLAHVGQLPLTGGADFWGLAFTADGQRLATLVCARPAAADGSCAGDLTVWDVDRRAAIAGPRTVPTVGGVFAGYVAFGGDDAWLATGHTDGTVRRWDAATLDEVASPLRIGGEDAGGLRGINTVSTGVRDGRGLLSATDHLGRAQVWDVTERRAVAVARTDNAVTARFGPGGALYTAAESGRATARDPWTLDPVDAPLVGHPGAAEFSFDRNGRTVTTTNTEVRIWDRASGRQSGGPLPALLYSAVSPDGRRLITGAGGAEFPDTGTHVRVWPLDPRDWERVACAMTGRNLTTAEWETHLPADTPYRPTCPQWPAATAR
jgi:DNA-binding SARP family transcriptional activator/WD40 repeat protein/tRNA A-37 threonylcarbamoyl transferase component Bud32